MALKILLGGRLTITKSNLTQAIDDIRKPTRMQCTSILTKYNIMLAVLYVINGIIKLSRAMLTFYLAC